jgi:hypothetical protein
MYKDYEFEPRLLTKCILAALLTGILVSLADEVYNFAYRGITGFTPSEIINVSSLIFVTLTVFMVFGVLYFLLSKLGKRTDLIYIIATLVITAIGFLIGTGVQRSTDPHISELFRWLFIGIELMIGLSAAFLIPYFVKHYRIFF